MANAWLSYAWANNRDSDVDYIAQYLTENGLPIRMDKNRIAAGKRIWEQIGSFIRDPAICNAWIIYATQESLNSEPVKEELYYALDRALESRGQDFPIIALFPETVDKAIIPPVIKTRLYVSLTDPDWMERVKAASEGRLHQLQRKTIEPYYMKVWRNPAPSTVVTIEVRPRAGVWNPVIYAVPSEEAGEVGVSMLLGAPGRVPGGGVMGGLFNQGEARDTNGANWSWQSVTVQSTPTMSMYITCRKAPTRILFGDQNSGQYTVLI